jgi:AcrR family transcriptional regulator
LAQAGTSLQRKPKPRWQRRKDARPEEILSAALEAFAERGFAVTTLEDIAQRAGVTKGTIYLYFESKEAVFRAVVRESIVPAIELGERFVAEHRGTARALLGELIRKWWELIGETGLAAIPKLVMAEAANFPELARFYHQAVIRRGKALFAGVLERGIAAGEFRPLDVHAAVGLAIAPLVHAVVLRHSLLKCVREPLDVRAYVGTHIDIFLRGIAKQPFQDAPDA